MYIAKYSATGFAGKHRLKRLVSSWERVTRLVLGASLAAALLAFAGNAGADAQQRLVVDSAGRKVTLPASVAHVMAAGPPAAVLLYTLAPDALLGWPVKLRAEALALLPPKVAALPVVGSLTSRHAAIGPEAVAALHPDLIVDVGTIDERYAALADRIQQATGIPYLLLDGTLLRAPESYRMLGPLLGQAERGEELAREAARLLAEAAAAKAALSERRPRVFYGRGPDALQTAPPGSILAEALEVSGAANVLPDPGKGGSTVTIEQIAGWAPDMLLLSAPEARQAVLTQPAWQAVVAVRAHRVYLAPDAPFGWIDEPPSVNRLLGLHWLAGILASGAPPADMKETARGFYRRFYGIELTDAQLDRLLAPAMD